jgi:hypothetical protein
LDTGGMPPKIPGAGAEPQKSPGFATGRSRHGSLKTGRPAACRPAAPSPPSGKKRVASWCDPHAVPLSTPDVPSSLVSLFAAGNRGTSLEPSLRRPSLRRFKHGHSLGSHGSVWACLSFLPLTDYDLRTTIKSAFLRLGSPEFAGEKIDKRDGGSGPMSRRKCFSARWKSCRSP